MISTVSINAISLSSSSSIWSSFSNECVKRVNSKKNENCCCKYWLIVESDEIFKQFQGVCIQRHIKIAEWVDEWTRYVLSSKLIELKSKIIFFNNQSAFAVKITWNCIDEISNTIRIFIQLWNTCIIYFIWTNWKILKKTCKLNQKSKIDILEDDLYKHFQFRIFVDILYLLSVI